MSAIGGFYNGDGSPLNPALRSSSPAPPPPSAGPSHVHLFHAPGSALFHDTLRNLHLVADARIDNRCDLTAELHSELDRAATPSDPALILAAYRRWGDDCADHLIGDFAFAIWDAPRQRLLCARDAIGVRPLHWTQLGPTFAFASDVETLLRLPGASRELDRNMLAVHLTSAPIDAESTYYRAIRRVPNGHTLSVTRDGPRPRPYWQIDRKTLPPLNHPDDARDTFLATFEQACSDRLPPPGSRMGILLSGGLDSSSVAAVLRRHVVARGSTDELFACSYVYDELPSCDERRYIELTRTALALPEIAVRPEAFPFLTDDDETDVAMPANFWHPAHGAALRALQARGVNTIFTGHGGDQLLAVPRTAFLRRLPRDPLGVVRDLVAVAALRGHAPHQAFYHHLLAPLLPRAPRRLARRLLRGPATERFFPPWLTPDFVQQTGIGDLLQRASAPLSLGMLLQPTPPQFPTQLRDVWRLLHWHAIRSAHHGMQVHHPFFDRRLFELVRRLPPEQFYGHGQTKHVLRESMRGLLPEPVRTRLGKTYLQDFIHQALKRSAATTLARFFAQPRLADMRIIDASRFRTHLARSAAGGCDTDWAAIWHTMGLERWLRHIHAD